MEVKDGGWAVVFRSCLKDLQDVLADGSAVVEVVEADGNAVPENEGASVLLFVGAEALFEVLVSLEAAPQLHGLPVSPPGVWPQDHTGVRGHTFLRSDMCPGRLKARPQLDGLLWSSGDASGATGF